MIQFLSTAWSHLAGSNARRRRKNRNRRENDRQLLAEPLEPRRLLAKTVGVLAHDPAETYDGYTLFSPELYNRTFLIDNQGRRIHTWKSRFDPANVGYMLPDGSLLRAANLGLNNVGRWRANGIGGKIELITWEGKRIWNYNYKSPRHIQHHDLEPILNPDGSLKSVLFIAFDYMSPKQVIANGRNPNQIRAQKSLLPDSIIEVERTGRTTGKIVWEWHLRDHFVQDFSANKKNWYGPNGVKEHPELVDINYDTLVGAKADFTHANGVDYNAERDEIAISVRQYSEVWVIDHSTTRQEARGHTGGDKGKGGDLLWRFGNPAAYKMGTAADRDLYFQHNAEWTPDGDTITVFNNGTQGKRRFSTVDEIDPELDVNGNYVMNPGEVAEGEIVWTFGGPNRPGFFAAIISGTHRLPNGNTLVSEGTEGRFFEVTPDKRIVWNYINPVTDRGPLRQGQRVPVFPFFSQLGVKNNFTFFAIKYGKDYFNRPLDLTPKRKIERPALGGNALRLAGGTDAPELAALGGSVVVALAETQLAPVVDHAVSYVAARVGNNTAQALSNLTWQIVDLPGNRLGQVVGERQIQIDVDAAGRGWSSGPVEDRKVDLLTTVLHEIGHVLGYGHTDRGIMNATLRPGTRPLWGDEVDAVFAGV